MRTPMLMLAGDDFDITERIVYFYRNSANIKKAKIFTIENTSSLHKWNAILNSNS